MFAYLLFLKKDDEEICENIYAEEEGQLFNYSFEEDYIVKTEEVKYKNVKELEAILTGKGKTSTKGKKKESKSKLIKNECQDIKQALYFLSGSLDDFKQGIHAHKKLPQIVNPYDLDFDGREDDFTPGKEEIEDEFNEEKLLNDLKSFQNDDDDDKIYDDPNDDDFY